MNPLNKKQRIYAILLIFGACILLFRTIRMVYFDAYTILMVWVFILLILEMLIDITCLISSIIWYIADDVNKSKIPLRLGASAAILHAVRVLIFVLGRTEPFMNFDVRPEQRALHSTRWSWFWVYFAATMSILGIIGVIVIYRLRKRSAQLKSY
jgi:hypothetical protein